MQQDISFSSINPLKIKSFFRKLSAISDSYSDKEHYVDDFGIQPKKYEGPYTKAETPLRERIKQLEEDLLKVSEERDIALEENRKKIDELNITLLSVRETLEKLRKAKERKEKRIRQLEEKINKTVKVRSHIPSH
ncbi:hypothetical protein HYW19_02550 [Candidatus Woesearchaeota archaeon]|nr:hypothetical protein [Candidatus Woesearchaeota archaeon]